MPPSAPLSRGLLREFGAGAGFLRRGFGLWLTSPRLMLLGALPALIVALVYIAGIAALAVNLGGISEWMTPFADGWGEPWKTGTRVAAGVAVVTVGILVLVYTYAAVTLLVGDPFYERIWRSVETSLGSPPIAPDVGLFRSLVRAVVDGARLLLPAVLVGLLLVLSGLIPVVGGALAFTLGAAFGGWVLVRELTGFAFDARGFSLRERRQMLARRRATCLGFGVVTYLLFLVPFAAVFVMPAAVAGATMLSRDVLTPR
ncbi:hypothetical protein JF66_11420 [Cryobacterium sp. MLB-32]|uniref:EI24 domain-containing protein n=1 Tax=Cryobacterium sp. MLB-32 TaxID=1529318 RepID=UPI0004E6F6CE|nr:EI24 domain-containing protein [Cryobacterium sp. MLB-32]KFF59418.1 hypothetical protein JF66_11420 [Cryobacterium sp. MLB-32]